MRAANASTFLPKVDFDAAEKLVRSGGALFVDARKAEDFRKDRIPDAVNLPATIPESEARRVAAGLPRDRRLVVYCSHATCAYSYITAQRLLDSGFTDVVVYPGGLEEWNAKVAPADE